jgi:metal-responsive CopG/Arc/MetJ family transcriptional regulator
MKKEYDFSRGIRGAVIKTPPGKERITIRLDDDILEWFRNQVHEAGGGNYQSLINKALREYVQSNRESLADTLRIIVREELTRYKKKRKTVV